MDYTTVPRSLIYRERRSLEEFGAYEKESITRPLAEAMLHMDFIQYTDSENRALWCLNTAYYICTMILLETDPRWRISKYKGLAIPKWNFGNGDFQVLTLALAGLLLSRLEEPLPLLSSKGQTRNHFVALMLDDGEFNPVFKQLYERVKADPYIKGTIPNSTFAPRVIDKECIDDVMSDSVFNWVSFTKYWESRSMLDIVKCLGTNEDEKHNLIDMLRQSSHGFYSAGCNDYPEQVDAILDSFDQEIHMQYNPETDQTMEENNSEQNNYLELKPFEKALIDSLKDENARLREEINQIKEYIKGAITIDDVNEALIVGEFGLSPEKAKKMVADAIAKAEKPNSADVQQENKLGNQIGDNQQGVDETPRYIESLNRQLAKEKEKNAQLEEDVKQLRELLDLDQKMESDTMRLQIDERIILITTALGTPWNSDLTNQTQLAKIIEYFSGDAFRSIRSRIVAINREMKQEISTPGDGLSQGTKEAINNVIGWLEKATKGDLNTPATDKLIQEIKDVFLNTKE